MKRIILGVIAIVCFTCVIEAKSIFKSMSVYASAYERMSCKEFIDKAKDSGEYDKKELDAVLKHVKAIEVVMLMGQENIDKGMSFINELVAGNGQEEIEQVDRGMLGLKVFGKIDGDRIRNPFLMMNSNFFNQMFCLAIISFEGYISESDLKTVVDSVEFKTKVNLESEEVVE